MRAGRLALADGTVFHAEALGTPGTAAGEVVFNTAMTGYEEILTDPSYAGQIVTLTYPEIGNYGFSRVDGQSASPLAIGVLVRHACAEPSNWRSRIGLDAWLCEQGLRGLSGLDTRALTRRLRDQGAQMGVISDEAHRSDDELVALARAAGSMEGCDLASRAGCRRPYFWTEPSPTLEPAPAPVLKRRVVVVDFGVKRGILRQLVDAGCSVEVVPFTETADSILARRPDGVVLSNGPGDPAAVPGAQELVRGLVGRVPLLGICLGHQILALALGGRTYKLKFGHRGGNHPVLEADTGKVEITAQNHGFAVDPESLAGVARVTHRSLFDGTCEGIEVPGRWAFSVQHHPEANPGPSDAQHLFARFVRGIEAWPARGTDAGGAAA